MGFSVVSLIEILYFLTIRPYCAMRRKQLHHKKKGQKSSKLNQTVEPHEFLVAHQPFDNDHHKQSLSIFGNIHRPTRKQQQGKSIRYLD